MASTSFLSLPTELVLEIASNTDDASVLHLIMCNSFLSTLLLPILHTRALAPQGTRTAMQWASDRAHLSLTKLLLDRGIDPDDGACYEEPPALRSAVFHGRTDIVELLCAHGADVNQHTRGGLWCFERVIHLAAQKGDAAMIKLLASHGADVVAENIMGGYLGSPLHHAVLSSDVAAVRVLMDLHVPVQPDDSNGDSPLDIAAMVVGEDVDSEEWYDCMVAIGTMLVEAGSGMRYESEEALKELVGRPREEKTVRFFRQLMEVKARLVLEGGSVVI